MANPFTGFILPGAGAGGINIIDSQRARESTTVLIPDLKGTECKEPLAAKRSPEGQRQLLAIERRVAETDVDGLRQGL